MNKQHDNHIEARIARIEESVGKIRESAGLTQGALEQVLERLFEMPVSKDMQDAFDAVRAALQGDALREHDEFIAAMQAQDAIASAKIDALTAKVDELIAKGGTASADELALVRSLVGEVDTAVDAIVPTATPPPGP